MNIPGNQVQMGSFWIENFLPNFQDIHFWMRSSSNSPWVSPAPLRVPTPKPPSWRPMVAKAPCATWHAACGHPRGLRNDASEQLNMAQGSTMHWRFCPMKLENNRKIQDIIKQIMWCQYLDHHILQLLCCLRVDTTVSRSIACSEVGAVRSPASFHLPRSLLEFVHTNSEEMWRCQCWAYLLLWDPRGYDMTALIEALNLAREDFWSAGCCLRACVWFGSLGVLCSLLMTVLVFELMPRSGALVLPRNQVCDESCMTVRYFKCGNFRRSRWWVAPLHLHKKPILLFEVLRKMYPEATDDTDAGLVDCDFVSSPFLPCGVREVDRVECDDDCFDWRAKSRAGIWHSSSWNWYNLYSFFIRRLFDNDSVLVNERLIVKWTMRTVQLVHTRTCRSSAMMMVEWRWDTQDHCWWTSWECIDA